MSTLYRKKPVVINAIQFVETGHDETNLNEVWQFMDSPDENKCIIRPPGAIGIVTLEGTMWAEPGDWIVRGVKGEFYPVKPDIFQATYEPAVSADA